MNSQRLPLIVCVLVFMLAACKKSPVSPNCWGPSERVMLYYHENCATITGHVKFIPSGEIKVITNNFPKKYRVDSVEVRIRYKDLGPIFTTADCLGGEGIKIRCITDLD